MRKHLNFKVGDKILHHLFGECEVKEITDKYIVVDHPQQKGFRLTNNQTGAKVMANGKPAIEIVYDGPVGTYDIAYEFQARPINPESSNLRRGTMIIANSSEMDAVKEVEKRVTGYKHYDSNFYINTVTPVN